MSAAVGKDCPGKAGSGRARVEEKALRAGHLQNTIMTQYHFGLGYARVRECMQSAQDGDLHKTIESMANARLTSQSNADVFAGACRALLDVTAALELGGLHVIDDGGAHTAYLRQSPAAREVALGVAVNNRHEVKDLELMLSALCGVAQGQRARVTWQFAKAAEPPPPRPVDVRIVSMPERRRQTTVERDADDNIEKTVCIESDLKSE